MKYNVTELRQIIHNRRTIPVPKMTDKPIPQDILNDIIESANWAPTHGLTEPWRLFLFEDNARVKLGEFMADLYQKKADPFNQNQYDKLKNVPTLPGAVLGIGMKRQETRIIAEIEEISAVACAVQNMHLMATAHGIGAKWSSPSLCYTSEMREYVGLTENDHFLGFFYLGYTDIDWPEGRRLSSIREKVTILR